MCVLPMTGRSTVGIGGERGDNSDNSNSCSVAGGGGTNSGSSNSNNNINSDYNSDSSGGHSAAGVNITHLGIRNADEEVNTVSRKSVMLDPRHTRAQGIRKLQKCLSTATSHFEVDSTSGAAAAFPSISLFYAQRSTEMRSSIAPQASLNYQNILTNTRQYSSFGSITVIQL